MSSIRKKIQQQLMATLAQITTVNGYQNNVVTVTKTFKSIEQVASFPHLSVLEGEQTLTPASEEWALYSAVAAFAIVGAVKADHDSAGEGKLSDACDSLIEDVKEALLANVTAVLSGIDAGQLRLLSDEPIIDDQNNTGYVAIFLTVSYLHGENV